MSAPTSSSRTTGSSALFDRRMNVNHALVRLLDAPRLAHRSSQREALEDHRHHEDRDRDP